MQALAVNTTLNLTDTSRVVRSLEDLVDDAANAYVPAMGTG